MSIYKINKEYPLKKWLSCHAEFISASKIEILKQVQNDIILRGYNKDIIFKDKRAALTSFAFLKPVLNFIRTKGKKEKRVMATIESNGIFATNTLIPVKPSSTFRVGDLLKTKQLVSDYSFLKKTDDFKELTLNDTRHLLNTEIQKFELAAKHGLFINMKSFITGLGNRLSNIAALKLEPTKFVPATQNSSQTDVRQTTARSAGSLNLSANTDINPNVLLKQLPTATAFTSGTFRVNGKTITINKDLDTFNDVLSRINTSGAGVTATLEQGKLVLRGPTVTTANGTSNFWVATKIPVTTVSGAKATVTADIPIVHSTDPGVKAQVVGNRPIEKSTYAGVVALLYGNAVQIAATGTYDFGTININGEDVTLGSIAIAGATDTARSQDAVTKIVNKINLADNHGGVYAYRTTVSILGVTYSRVTLRGDFDPININSVTFSAPAGDDMSPGFSGGEVSTNQRLPQTDLGIITLNGTTINLGVVNNVDFADDAALGQYVKNTINTYSATTLVDADIDAENRLILTHQQSGVANKVILTGVTTESELPVFATNNKGVGLYNVTRSGVDPRTDFGKMTLNGVNISIGWVSNTNALYDTIPELATFVANRIHAYRGSTGVAASVSADNKIVLTQQTAGSAKVIEIQDFTPDVNNYAPDTQSAGFNLGTWAGTNTELKSSTTLGVSDYTRTLDALKGKFSPELISTTNGKFSINGVIINYNTTVDKISDVVDRINNSPATRVTARFDEKSAIFILTRHDPGPEPIDLQDLVGNFLESFKVQGTKGLASAKSQTTLGIQGNYYAIDPTKLLKDINTATPITSGTFTVNGISITINKDTDTFNAVMARINSLVPGVTASIKNDMLDLQSGAAITLAAGTSNFISATMLGGNITTTTPATAANITVTPTVSLTPDVDTAATNTGTTPIALSADAGVTASLNGSTYSVASNTTYDLGKVQINGQTVNLDNYTTITSADVTLRSQKTAEYIRDKINATAGAGVTASTVLAGSYYRVNLTGDNYGNILIGDITYSDTANNRTVGFYTGQYVAGRAPSTDFGRITLNGYTIYLDNIFNAGNTNESAAQYVADQLNSFTQFTNVTATVDASNQIKLDQLTAGASYGINITSVVADSDGIGTNNSSIGFIVSNIKGTDAKTDFGNMVINGTTVNFNTVFNRDYTDASAVDYIATKINTTAGITVTASVNSENNIVLTQKTAGAAPSINITAINPDSDANPANNRPVGFVVGNTANGTNAVTVVNRTSTSYLGVSDLNRIMDTLGNKFAVPLISTTTGRIKVNGVNVNYNTKTQKLQNVINNINAAVPGVLASYNSSTNKFEISSNGAAQVTVTDVTGNLAQALDLQSEDVKTVVPYFQELGNNNQGLNNGAGTDVISTNQWHKLSNISLDINKGSLLLNGKRIEINPDDTLDNVLTKINTSNAGITAYMHGNRVVLAGDKPIDLNKALDTSGFLKALGLDTAKQQGGQIATVTGFKPITLKQGTEETDFGSITINDVNIDIGTINNKDYNAKTGAEYVASAINAKATETNVGAFVDSQNRIVLSTGGTGENAVIDVQNVSSALGIGAGKVTGKDYILMGTVDTAQHNLMENIHGDIKTALNNIKGFTAKFNDAIDFILQNTKKGQTLANDTVANSVKKELSNMTNKESGEGEYNTFASVGITFKDNKLQIDEEKFVTALRTNPNEVLNLFGKTSDEFNNINTGISSTIRKIPVLKNAVKEVLTDITQNMSALHSTELNKDIMKQLTVLQKSQDKLKDQNKQITNIFTEKPSDPALIKEDKEGFLGKKIKPLNINGFGTDKTNELLNFPKAKFSVFQVVNGILENKSNDWQA